MATASGHQSEAEGFGTHPGAAVPCPAWKPADAGVTFAHEFRAGVSHQAAACRIVAWPPRSALLILVCILVRAYILCLSPESPQRSPGCAATGPASAAPGPPPAHLVARRSAPGRCCRAACTAGRASAGSQAEGSWAGGRCWEARQRADMRQQHGCRHAAAMCVSSRAAQSQAGMFAQWQRQTASRGMPATGLTLWRSHTSGADWEPSVGSRTWPSRPTSWGCLPAPRPGATPMSAGGTTGFSHRDQLPDAPGVVTRHGTNDAVCIVSAGVVWSLHSKHTQRCLVGPTGGNEVALLPQPYQAAGAHDADVAHELAQPPPGGGTLFTAARLQLLRQQVLHLLRERSRAHLSDRLPAGPPEGKLCVCMIADRWSWPEACAGARLGARGRACACAHRQQRRCSATARTVVKAPGRKCSLGNAHSWRHPGAPVTTPPSSAAAALRPHRCKQKQQLPPGSFDVLLPARGAGARQT